MLETSFSRVLGPFFVAQPKSSLKLRRELSGAIIQILAGQDGKDIKRFQDNQRMAFTVFIPVEVLRCQNQKKISHMMEAEQIVPVLRADLQTNCDRQAVFRLNT